MNTARKLAGALALTLGLGLLGAPPASATDPNTLPAGVTQRVLYNDPRVSDPARADRKTAIVDRLEQVMRHAAPGSTGRIVTWRWDREQATDRALEAVDRGVDLRIALTGHSWAYSATTRLERGLKARGQGWRLIKCSSSTYDNGSCLGTRPGATEHVKLATWSNTGDKRNLVQVTSSNMSNGQVDTYNDLIETAGDLDHYTRVTAYINDTLAKKRDGRYRQNRGTFHNAGAHVTAYLGPSGRNADGTLPDDIAASLAKLGGRPGCKVYVPTSQWDDRRSKVATQVARLKAEGCRAGVLSRIQTDSTADTIRGKLTAARIDWRKGEPHQHVKEVIALDAVRRGTTTPASVLHAGSEHLNGDVWRNAEGTFAYTYRPLVEAAAVNFERNAARAGLTIR